MARAVRSRPQSRRKILPPGVESGEPEAIARAFRPPRARPLPAPHGGATEAAKPARVRVKMKRGPSKARRKESSLGPAGRARARVGAVPHGKKTTGARATPGRHARRGGKHKSVRGSPKARRRIANRRAKR